MTRMELSRQFLPGQTRSELSNKDTQGALALQPAGINYQGIDEHGLAP